MLRRSVCFIFTACLVLAACQTDDGVDQPVASLAPVAKVKTAPVTGPGLLLGSWIGADDAALDDNDHMKNRQAEKRAFTASIGQQVTWNNPESGHAGTVTPVRDVYANNGDYCRQFQETVTVARPLQGHVTACQQADGSWKVVH